MPTADRIAGPGLFRGVRAVLRRPLAAVRVLAAEAPTRGNTSTWTPPGSGSPRRRHRRPRRDPSRSSCSAGRRCGALVRGMASAFPPWSPGSYSTTRCVSSAVTNFGETGYVSTQNLIALMLELRAGRRPDVVVFYDGVNDTYSAYSQQRAGLPHNESESGRRVQPVDRAGLTRQGRVFVGEMSRRLAVLDLTKRVLRRVGLGDSAAAAASPRFADPPGGLDLSEQRGASGGARRALPVRAARVLAAHGLPEAAVDEVRTRRTGQGAA